MNKIIIVVTISFVGIISSGILFFSMTNYSVLGPKDIFIMIKDNKEPAITIPETKEKYFNNWKCFAINNIEITESEVNYYGWHKVPSINVKTKKGLMSFDIDPDIKWNNELVLKKWKELISSERSICIFGAFLQKENDGSSVWYIQRLKTKRGYWDRSE